MSGKRNFLKYYKSFLRTYRFNASNIKQPKIMITSNEPVKDYTMNTPETYARFTLSVEFNTCEGGRCVEHDLASLTQLLITYEVNYN